MAVVGFDVGNLSSYIAVARGGGIETIANEHSDRMTPSVVSYSGQQRSQGTEAKSQMVTHPKNTIFQFKRLIGRKFKDPAVQEELKRLPYTVTETKDGSIGIQVQYQGEQETFTPEQVMGTFLAKLKSTGEAALTTKVIDCVISVPQYYTDAERHSVLSAAKIAGLNCLRVMNDTTAVALAYGIYKQDLPAPEEKPRNVVFVDMGHSSLQVAICAFNKGKLKVLSTAADKCLGGRDFDYVIFEHLAKEFLAKFKVDVKSKARATQRVLLESEKLKKLMSANATKIPVNMESVMNDIDVRSHMQRSEFEALSADLLKRVEIPLKKALEQSKIKSDDIFSVEIIGGSTRVPSVKEIISKVFKKTLSTTLNQDEAVSRGCALQCAILSPTFRVREFAVTDLTPYPIKLTWESSKGAVKVVLTLEYSPTENPHDQAPHRSLIRKDRDSRVRFDRYGSGNYQRNPDGGAGEMVVFKQNDEVPFTRMLTFYRDQPFNLEAFYSEEKNLPYPDPFIGTYTVKNVTRNEDGESAKIKVKVNINRHGIFSVSSAAMVVKLPPEPEPEPEDKKDAKTADQKPSEAEAKSNGGGGEDATKMETDQESKPQENAQPSDEKMETEEGDARKDTKEDEMDAKTNGPDSGEKEEITEEENGKEGKKKGSKPKVKYTTKDLPIVPVINQLLPQDRVNQYFEKEMQMLQNDKLERDRALAKNNVEEYVYDMRDKLHSSLEIYITEEDREKFSKILTETEDWLYGDGEDLQKAAYVSKLEELRKLGDPVVKRSYEAGERPIAFDELGHLLQMYAKFLDQYSNGDEKYTHIPKEEVEKVEKMVKEKGEWRDKKQSHQNTLPLTKDPSILAAQIRAESSSLHQTCDPIVNKPKPAPPKVEPPKDEGEPPADSSEPMDTGSAENTTDAPAAPQEENMEQDTTQEEVD